MKKFLLNTFYFVLVLVFAASCNLVDKDFTVNSKVPVTFTSTSGQQVNPTVVEVDFNTGDIEENKDRIKDINIDEISYRVIGFTPVSGNNANPVLNGQLEYAPVGTTTFKKAAALTNVDLKALYNNAPATDPTVPVDATNKADLSALIKGGQKVQFRISGTTSAPFASAAIDFKIKSTVTAGL